MHIAPLDTNITRADVDAVALGIYADGPLSTAADAFEAASGVRIAALREQGVQRQTL